jgi:DNA-directed RNA polymerase specialized sigma24 family protein
VSSFDNLEAKATEVEWTAPDELLLLRECLDRLPPRERRSVQLRYYEQAPSAQIAGRG